MAVVWAHYPERGCGAPDCDGAFIGTSRAGRRRYCTCPICVEVTGRGQPPRQRPTGTH
ncbi:CGNR zinc finger domain-containing protein [Streptomyces sp. DW4-2]|uniref:CGNR zinc finger domain-containing protein n=1 Tax=Streptomyces spirodelae TaxID=2812904 RepID=A0ABS3WTL2_9ACTN|nr:CGNR zinc finger domain-containing protein [Streptomyces spirodelae]